MIIDFHTHFFPLKIAKTTIEGLEKNSSGKAWTDGTIEGLKQNMLKAGVNLSIGLPVMTKPTQFDSLNRFALTVNQEFSVEGGVISFAGIHPLCEDIPSKMKFIKESGFKGVKIHPDYQGCFIDHDGYIQILNCAKDLDLIVVTHSGVDDGYKNQPVRCPPELCAKVIDKVGHKKLVLGHYGAHKQWDKVLEILCEKDVYFDTAFTFHEIDERLFKDILYRHGDDKILFATDCPWRDMKQDLDILNGYKLDKSIMDKILYKNALKLLEI